MSTLHGTAVALGERGALILGAAGAGKSALALQLIALGATLVADDAVILSLNAGKIALTSPEPIKGIIEARGVGLISVKSVDQAGLEIVVDLDKTVTKRLPIPEDMTILGVEIPLIRGKDVPNLASVIWCILLGGQILPTE